MGKTEEKNKGKDSPFWAGAPLRRNQIAIALATVIDQLKIKPDAIARNSEMDGKKGVTKRQVSHLASRGREIRPRGKGVNDSKRPASMHDEGFFTNILSALLKILGNDTNRKKLHSVYKNLLEI